MNNRILDTKELLGGRIDSLAAARCAPKMRSCAQRMRDCASLIERHHSEIMAKLIEMDNRIVRLESQRLIQ